MCNVSNLGQPVWFHPGYITNVLSLTLLKRKYRITYDSELDGAFIVHRPGRKNLKFTQHPGGLHLWHPHSKREVVLVNTVSQNLKRFSRRQIEDAREACALLAKVGYPSERNLKVMIRSGMLHNCPITEKDIDNATAIYGTSVPVLKGKTTRKVPLRVRTDLIPVPPEIYDLHHTITIGMYIMFINKLPFLVTVSENIAFTTVEYIPDRSATSLQKAIQNVKRVYKVRGFDLTRANVDNEFDYLQSEMMRIGITLNTTSKGEHVPNVERKIRVLKERCRALRHTLPFKSIPRLMIIALVKFITRWINAFPTKGGIQTVSPRTLLTGTPIDFLRHCRLHFGSYVQVHEDNIQTNTSEAITTGAITLGPDNSIQTGYYFLHLNTGRRIHRRTWTEIPTPTEVVHRIETLESREGQEEILIFSTNSGPISDPSDHNIGLYRHVDDHLLEVNDNHPGNERDGTGDDGITGVDHPESDGENSDANDQSIEVGIIPTINQMNAAIEIGEVHNNDPDNNNAPIEIGEANNNDPDNNNAPIEIGATHNDDPDDNDPDVNDPDDEIQSVRSEDENRDPPTPRHSTRTIVPIRRLDPSFGGK